MSLHIGIIGTSGRDENGNKMTNKLFDYMICISTMLLIHVNMYI